MRTDIQSGRATGSFPNGGFTTELWQKLVNGKEQWCFETASMPQRTGVKQSLTGVVYMYSTPTQRTKDPPRRGKPGQLPIPVRRMDLKPWVVGMCVVPHINRFCNAKKVNCAIPVLSVLIMSHSQMPGPPTLSALLSVHSGESIN